MNTNATICPDCGEGVVEQTVMVLGTKHRLRGTCGCDKKREAMKLSRNPGALNRIVREQSRISDEFRDARLSEHPHPNGARIGYNYLDRMPNPLEDFLATRDWHESTVDDRAALRKMQVDAMRGRPSLYLWGEPGRGKSGLASAILNAMIARGIPSIAWNVRLLMDATKDSYSLRTPASNLWRPLHETPLLLLDDLDKARTSSADELGHLYSLAEARMAAKLPTIITANASIEDLGIAFMSAHGSLGEAIVDRFVAAMLAPVELLAPESFRRK